MIYVHSGFSIVLISCKDIHISQVQRGLSWWQWMIMGAEPSRINSYCFDDLLSTQPQPQVGLAHSWGSLQHIPINNTKKTHPLRRWQCLWFAFHDPQRVSFFGVSEKNKSKCSPVTMMFSCDQCCVGIQLMVYDNIYGNIVNIIGKVTMVIILLGE